MLVRPRSFAKFLTILESGFVDVLNSTAENTDEKIERNLVNGQALIKNRVQESLSNTLRATSKC